MEDNNILHLPQNAESVHVKTTGKPCYLDLRQRRRGYPVCGSRGCNHFGYLARPVVGPEQDITSSHEGRAGYHRQQHQVSRRHASPLLPYPH
jgi:hypothetical protein